MAKKNHKKELKFKWSTVHFIETFLQIGTPKFVKITKRFPDFSVIQIFSFKKKFFSGSFHGTFYFIFFFPHTRESFAIN